MNRLHVGLIGVLVALLWVAPASAHEFILKPTPFADGTFAVDAVASHTFMQSDEAEPVKDVDVALLAKGERTSISLAEDTAKKCLSGKTPPVLAPALLVGHRKPQYWSDTTKDVQAGTRAELEAKGFKVLSVGRYEKFAKTLLHAEAGDTSVFNTVLEQPLEIVLLTNPADVKPRAVIKCRILRQGKPLATDVQVGYDGYSAQEDEYVLKTTSNAQGEAEFTVVESGLWFIRVAVTEKISAPDADKVNLRATYAFDVN